MEIDGDYQQSSVSIRYGNGPATAKASLANLKGMSDAYRRNKTEDRGQSPAVLNIAENCGKYLVLRHHGTRYIEFCRVMAGKPVKCTTGDAMADKQTVEKYGTIGSVEYDTEVEKDWKNGHVSLVSPARTQVKLFL